MSPKPTILAVAAESGLPAFFMEGLVKECDVEVIATPTAEALLERLNRSPVSEVILHHNLGREMVGNCITVVRDSKCQAVPVLEASSINRKAIFPQRTQGFLDFAKRGVVESALSHLRVPA